MSAHAPSELPLEAARKHLARKGYLGAGLPPAPVSRWQRAAYLATFALALALVLAWGAVAASTVPLRSVPVVAMGFLPAVALGVAIAVLLGELAAGSMLRLGATPALLANGFAVASGVCVLGLITLAVIWTRPIAPAAIAPVWLLGGALAAEATWATSQALLGELSLGRPSPPPWGRLRWLTIAGLAVATGGIAAAIALRGAADGSEMIATSFPQPHGRIAVVAVDGLAREDVDALGAGGDTDWGRVAGWGWAPLRRTGARLPAVLWTTVACGVGPERHGVIVLDEVRLLGSRDGVPLRGLLRSAVTAFWGPLGGVTDVARPALTRRAPTFWEMASRAGCPVTVGGWWGSWPVRRVVGNVVSERAWLGGGTGTDAVTPAMAALVDQVWTAGVRAPEATDALAAALAERAGHATGAHLVAVAMPALDLVRRAAPRLPPIAWVTGVRPHLAALHRVIEQLLHGGYAVWLVAVPWGAGSPFVACSAAGAGEHEPLATTALASTWLDQLGLPSPRGALSARRDLSGALGDLARAAYGPPPPPLAAPPAHALAVQREVLRSLGYLQ